MEYVKKFEHKTIVALVVTLLTTTILTTITIVWGMYNATIRQQEKLLFDSVRAHSTIINSFIEKQKPNMLIDEDKVINKAIELLKKSHLRSKKYISIDEYVVAKKENNEIEFLFSSNNDPQLPHSVSLTEKLTAEPMRRALRGEEGIIFALDYADRSVLAAYKPIISTKQLSLGIVKKTHLQKFRLPFFKAAGLGILVAIILVTIGIFVIIKVTRPILTHLADRTYKLQIENHRRQRAEKQLSILVNSVPVGIIVLDKTNNIHDVNKKAIQILAYEKHEMLEQPIDNFFSFLNIDFHENLFDELISRKENKILLAQKKGSSSFSLEVTPGEMYLEGSKFTTLAILDISERKQLEISQEKMHAAQAANKAKSQFLSNMSHELRTPLNGIIGTLEILSNTNLDSYQTRFIKMANIAADTLMAVIGDILDFSKIEAGKLKINEHPFNLTNILESVSTLAKSAHKKNIELLCSIAPNVPVMVVGDSIRLSQVLINIVGNAIKFTHHGEVSLRITIDEAIPKMAQNIAHIKFAVCDTGIGISENKKQQIFEAFVQADASTTRNYGGTGLGLSISSELVRMMSGKLCVESTEGQGSTFYFTLPLKFLKEKPNVQEKKLENLSVLVVDDNNTNLVILEEILKSWRMTVNTVTNAQQAITMTKTSIEKQIPFDLLITDYQMPTMNGYTMLQKMHNDSLLVDTKVVILTSSFPIENESYELYNACLEKPIIRSHLLYTIQKIMGWSSHSTYNLPKVLSKKLNILLVEDSEINQTIALDYLTSAGHKVTVANNGEEALIHLSTNEFDVILMDIQMPKMNGIQATQQIRQNRKHKNLIIIAMTAHALNEDKERCISAGMNDYITKPLRIENLFSILGKYFPQKSNSEVFNIKNAMLMLNNNTELFNRIINLFAKKSDVFLKQIQDDLDSSDCKQLVISIHKLKGTLSNFSADSALYTLQKLQNSAQENDFTQAKIFFCEFKNKIHELQIALQNWQKKRD